MGEGFSLCLSSSSVRIERADGKYLIAKHTILTAPAIDVLRFTRQKPSQKPTSPNDILVVGNPIMPKVSIPLGSPAKQLPNLPGSEREAQAVAQMFKTTAIIGKNATETAIVQKLPTAKLIHLATHGLLDDVKEVGVPGAMPLATALRYRVSS